MVFEWFYDVLCVTELYSNRTKTEPPRSKHFFHSLQEPHPPPNKKKVPLEKQKSNHTVPQTTKNTFGSGSKKKVPKKKTIIEK